MRYHFTEEEYQKIEELVECALFSRSKVQANRYIKRIRYVVTDLAEEAENALNELITATNAASSHVKGKEELEYIAKMSLHKLHSMIQDE